VDLTRTSKSQHGVTAIPRDPRETLTEQSRHVRCIVIEAKVVVMGPAEMSKRTHFWLRVAALAVIAAAAWIPRSSPSASSASIQTDESRAIHASVTAQ
jgi:hypothetical protein